MVLLSLSDPISSKTQCIHHCHIDHQSNLFLCIHIRSNNIKCKYLQLNKINDEIFCNHSTKDAKMTYHIRIEH